MLLAELYVGQQKYKDARRHLTAALAVNFRNAAACYQMARAIEEDAEADISRAHMYYARAVELDREQPTYWVDFGSFLFTQGKKRPALQAIRKGFALGIHDAAIVSRVAEVLRREGRLDEATAMLRQALFANHGAQAMKQAMQTHQFQMIYLRQEEEREARDLKVDSPRVLPFEPKPTEGKYVELGGKTIRIDQAEPTKEPQQKAETPTIYKRPQKG